MPSLQAESTRRHMGMEMVACEKLSAFARPDSLNPPSLEAGSKGFNDPIGPPFSENKLHRELDDPGVTGVQPVVAAHIVQNLTERRGSKIHRRRNRVQAGV